MKFAKFFLIFFNFLTLSSMLQCGLPLIEKINVINGTRHPIDVTHTLPEYSKATIDIQKFNSLQDMLYKAILSNSTKEIISAVHAGADVNAEINGKAPLMWAMTLKKLNAVEVLKNLGAKIKSPEKMLYRAILNDSAEEVIKAVNAGADIKSHYTNFVAKAVSLSRPKALEALIKCGAEIQNNANTILKAMRIGDVKIALVLIKHGARFTDPNAHHNGDTWGPEIMRHTIEYYEQDPENCSQLIQELINRGYNINNPEYNKNIWGFALQYPDSFTLELAELFIQNGANPNQIIGEKTPLFIAISNNDENAVKILLEVGANANKTVSCSSPRSGIPVLTTPLSFAQSLKNYDNKSIIKLLMQNRRQN